MRIRHYLILLASGAAIMTALSGCGNRGHTSKISEPKGYLIAAFDRTGSTEQIRARQLRELYDLVDRARIYKTEATIWALDNKPVVIWDGGVPTGRQDRKFIENVKSEMRPRSSATSKISCPGRLLTTINTKLKNGSLPDGPLALFISTDGAMEDPEDNTVLIQQAQVFTSKHPNACVILSGIESRNRAAWDKAFGHMTRTLLFVGSPTDDQLALKRFREFMKGSA